MKKKVKDGTAWYKLSFRIAEAFVDKAATLGCSGYGVEFRASLLRFRVECGNSSMELLAATLAGWLKESDDHRTTEPKPLGARVRMVEAKKILEPFRERIAECTLSEGLK